MKTVMRLLVAAAILVLLPATARAEWYVFPFASANTGGDTTRDSGAFGGSVGWTKGWLSAEGEFAWAPEFFDEDDGFRTRHKATTYTATALAGPKIGAWRPYAAAGAGVLRVAIEEVGGLASVADDSPALHLGGGLMWQGHKHIGIRGDARYIRALDDREPEGNVFAERLAEFNYWRVGAGVSIRW